MSIQKASAARKNRIWRNPKSDRRQSTKPEWKYQLLVCILVLMEKLSKRLGSIASIWAMTILLGGFVTGLSSYDFWVISALALASSLRLFGSNQEQKLNPRTQFRRHVLLRWIFQGREFHISASTIIAGILDLVMYFLQISSAMVSLVFSILRLTKSREFTVETGGSRNQTNAMALYYSMVLIETVVFLPAKLCWEIPRDVFVQKDILFRLSVDRDRLNKIFNIWDNYFAKVHEAARESTTRGLDMSLRSHISDTLVNEPDTKTMDVPAALLLLDTLYQRGEWIKRKADAEKRARLLPFVFTYIDDHWTGLSRSHESGEAAVSLLISLLVNKTNTPEPSKFGPLVLLRAVEDGHPKAIEIMSRDPIRGQVTKYLQGCLNSCNKDEVIMALDVVRRLPSQFHQGVILEAMVQQVSKKDRPPPHSKHVNVPALVLWRLSEFGHRDRIDETRISEIVEDLIRNGKNLKVRELEILVGLGNEGLLRPEQVKKVGLRSFFCEHNFMRCLPVIVEWLSLLDDETRRAQLQPNRKALVRLLQSPAGHRPDVFKLCKVLERDIAVFVDLQPVIVDILKPEEEC